LGLSVVYGVIKNHHGFVDVESHPGQGTTFYLYFPVQAHVVRREDQKPVSTRSVPGGKETILIVEDEEMLLDLLRTLLEEKGYRVLSARDGQEGVTIYAEHHQTIACVLTDMGLPHLGGWEMFLQMRQINPSVKAILASGYCDPALRTEMMSEGAKDFIPKPYLPEVVLRRVREVIDDVPAT
jgi:CheY-like chemotaxis protein